MPTEDKFQLNIHPFEFDYCIRMIEIKLRAILDTFGFSRQKFYCNLPNSRQKVGLGNHFRKDFLLWRYLPPLRV